MTIRQRVRALRVFDPSDPASGWEFVTATVVGRPQVNKVRVRTDDGEEWDEFIDRVSVIENWVPYPPLRPFRTIAER